jgi:pimeloyl-ACP methyl ester carboxylesterase
MDQDGYLYLFKKNIYYKFINYRKEKPVLIFLHDALGSVQQWKDFPERLSEIMDLPCLVYDRHGYGRSELSLFPERTKAYLEIEAKECFLELVNKLGIGGPFILIGHSDGGSIALIISAIIPQQVLAAVCISGHIFVEDITLQGIKDTVSLYNNTDMKAKLETFHGDKTTALFNAWSNTWLSPSFRNWSIEKYLKDISCPVLIIQGEDDNYATLKHVEAIQKGLKSKTEVLIVADCGHSPHKEQPELILSAINNFYKKYVLL